MSAGAKEQVARLLALVPLIAREGSMRVDEAAARLGIQPTQLVRDLRVLIYCGWPGRLPGDLIEVDLDALDGESIIRIHNADYLAAPLRFSIAEASAMVVALRTLREVAEPDAVSSIDGALARIEAALPLQGLTSRVDVQVAPGQREEAGLRHRLAEAIDAGRQVELDYLVPTRDSHSQRVVDPIRVLDRQGTSYLHAWCHTAGETRFFRLDRVLAATVLETRATPHPGVAADELGDEIFRPSPEHPLATLHLASEARWVAEYHPIEAAREVAGGALEVDLRVTRPEWLVALVLRLAPHARVLAPQQWAHRVEEAARAMLGLHG